MPKRLTRSRDRLVAGVCAGIAEHLGWSTNAVRLLYAIVSTASAAFPGILAYLILWVFMPPPDPVERRFEPFADRP